jgi:MFS family permease
VVIRLGWGDITPKHACNLRIHPRAGPWFSAKADKKEILEIVASNKPRFFYGYVVVVAAFFIQAMTWGINNSYGVFFNPLLTEFGWLRATISGAVSMNFLVHGIVSIFMGGLNDRFGPRLIMTGCGFLMGLGYLLMTSVNAVWQLYLFYGLVAGIGLGGMDVIMLSTIARWFEKKRGTMSGLIKTGTGVGMLIMPIFITWLITIYGWRIAFAVLGILILVMIISLSQFLVRDPAKKGLLPDNEREAKVSKMDSSEHGLSFHETVHTRQFWTVCAVYFLILACVYTILLHIVQHAIDLGISATSAASVLAAIGGVSIAGRFLMGSAGDRIGIRMALLVCLLFLFAGLIWLQVAKTLWMFYVFAALYGFAHGGVFALGSPLVAGLFGTKSHGLIFGIVIFSSTIGGAIGPILAGHIFDVTRSYQAVFYILAGLSITGLILTASLKPVRQVPSRIRF